MKFKILSIVGARPQFIKLASIQEALAHDDRFEHKTLHSGQHYDHNMSSSFFDEFGLKKPDFQMDVGGLNHNEQIGRFLINIDQYFDLYNPDIVFVYGDTNTTAAAAIAASKRNIIIAHIEAGLREFNKSVPEEVNKLLTTSVSDLFFVPTQSGIMNLDAQGITNQVHLVGDVMLDHLRRHPEKISSLESIEETYKLSGKAYYYASCHRAVNTERKERLSEILLAINQVDFPVVFPLHPRTKFWIEKHELSYLLKSEHIRIIEPLGFWDNQSLIKHAKHVITDSGGIIKEAYFHSVPCSIIDDQTEWSEILEEQWAILCGADRKLIIASIKEFILPRNKKNAFGNSLASNQIVNACYDYLRK